MLEKFSFQKMTSVEIEESARNIIYKIFYFGDEWVEISYVHGMFMLRFCLHPRKDRWTMLYDEAIAALEKAQREVKEMDFIR